VAPDPDLTGRTALLTGATGGIGNAIARALHRQGATVKLSGRRAEVLEELATELGDRAEVLPADLSNPADVDALAERVGDVDVLVNNAGLPGSGLLTDYSREQVDRALEVNLNAPIRLTHALLPAMLERGRGHVVFVSSTAGKVAVGGAAIYAATKFGLRGFSFSLHEDLRGTGVGVTAVFPGFISGAGLFADTKLKLPPGTGTKTPEAVADAVLTGIATNRAEIDVMAPVQRLGGWLAGPFPRLVAASMRAAGGTKLAERMAEAQRAKR
jgi:short-subunit dehydrogenase